MIWCYLPSRKVIRHPRKIKEIDIRNEEHAYGKKAEVELECWRLESGEAWKSNAMCQMKEVAESIQRVCPPHTSPICTVL